MPAGSAGRIPCGAGGRLFAKNQSVKRQFEPGAAPAAQGLKLVLMYCTMSPQAMLSGIDMPSPESGFLRIMSSGLAQ